MTKTRSMTSGPFAAGSPAGGGRRGRALLSGMPASGGGGAIYVPRRLASIAARAAAEWKGEGRSSASAGPSQSSSESGGESVYNRPLIRCLAASTAAGFQ